MSLVAAGHEDCSSVFLSSSDDINTVEALVAVPAQPLAPVELDQDAGCSDNDGGALGQADTGFISTLPSDVHGNVIRSQYPQLEPTGPSRPVRPPGPFLWRLLPRCIRATTEEVCIAAEATLNVAPSELHVTVIKDGVKLPVRLDFLSDRQATGDDSDQPSRQRRGPGNLGGAMQAIAAWQSRSGREHVNHVLRSHRPDTELVLIWITPGIYPGLMLIELHAPPPTFSSGGSGPYPHTSASAPTQHGAASTGALESAWRSPASVGSVVPGRGIRERLPDAVSWTHGAAEAMMSMGGDIDRALLGESEAARQQAAPLTASLNHGRVFGLSALEPMQAARTNRHRLGPLAGREAMCSSGALTVVVVPDAGMEAEVCALLAMQYQRLPLPVNSSDPERSLVEEQHQGRQFGSTPGTVQNETVPTIQGNDGGTATIATAIRGAGSVPDEDIAVSSSRVEMDEDKDDARARERFLWDLGAWLDSTVRRATTQAMTEHTAQAVAAAAAAAAASPTLARRALSQPCRANDQAQQFSQRHPQLQQHPRRVLDDLQPVSEIEPLSEAPHSSRAIPEAFSVASVLRTEAWGPQQCTGGRAVTMAEEQSPLPQAALELLGFACSRGWAATSTNIVLGLMDMGHSMQAINAAVQRAHGWSALHLAVASGSAELVAMTALWRSYGRYGDGPAVQEEWRAMLATPGPGGLTPLHLAAVLPHPATAALDLMSTLPAETLTTWFGEVAGDSCTPAHYASRAGNGHLNDHALLCLATGTSALDLGTAEGLQEVLPYLNELQTDLANVTCSESADLECDAQEVPSIGAHSVGGGGGTAATQTSAPGGSLINPNALASTLPSPPVSMNSIFESASEGAARPPGLLTEAQTDQALVATGGPLPVANPAVTDIDIAAQSPQANRVPSLDSVAGIDRTINTVNRSAGGGFRSAVRFLVGGSVARAMAAAMPGPRAASKGSSSCSLRRFLPRLRDRFQCLRSGSVVDGDRDKGGVRGCGVASDGGGTASEGSGAPSSTTVAAVAGPTGLAAVPAALAPTVARDETQQGSRVRSVAESQGCSSRNCSSISNNRHISASEAQSFLPASSDIQTPAQLESLPQPQQPAGAIDTIVTSTPCNNSALRPSDARGTSVGQISQRGNAHSIYGQLARILSYGSSTTSCPNRSDVQPSQMRLLTLPLGEPYMAGATQLPTHGSHAPRSHATDSSACSLEPWSGHKRIWPEPSSVVAGLLDRVSPGASTRESFITTSPSWSTAYSQQQGSGSQIQGRMSSVAQQMATPPLPRVPSLTSPQSPTSMSLEEARLVAMRIMAAAAAAAVRNTSASAPAGPMTMPCPAVAGGAGGAGVSEAGDTAPAVAVAVKMSTQSAPATVGDRLLLELIRPLCHEALHKRLRQQTMDHVGRVRLHLMLIMQRMRAVRCGCQTQPALQRLHLQAQGQGLDVGEMALGSMRRGVTPAGLEWLHHQHQLQQRAAQVPPEDGPCSTAVPPCPIADLMALADLLVQQSSSSSSSLQQHHNHRQQQLHHHHLSLMPDAAGSATLGQRLRVPSADAEASNVDALPQATVAASVAVRGNVPTGSLAPTATWDPAVETAVAVETKATCHAEAESLFARGGQVGNGADSDYGHRRTTTS